MTAIALSPSAIFPRVSLSSALALLGRVALKRAHAQAMRNVALRATSAGSTASATDGDMILRVNMPGTLADDTFATTLDAATLTALVKQSAADDVEIVTTNLHAAFTMGGSKATMEALDIADWPEMDFAGPITADFTIGADVLREALDMARGAISTEETRYYLNGIFIHTPVGSDGLPTSLRFVATDGHRLVRHQVPTPAMTGSMPGIILPRAAVAVLMHMLKPTFTGTGKAKVRTSPDSVRVHVNCTKIRFTFGDLELTSNVIDGTFPDYQRVIPAGNPRRLTVNAKAFGAMVDRVSAVNTERAASVKLSMDADLCEISARNCDGGSMSDVLAVTYDAAPLDVGFNAKYLGELLAACPVNSDGNVNLLFNDAGSPLLASRNGTGEDATIFVLMPMRV